MGYTSIQSQLRRFGGAVLRAKIKRMNLETRFRFLLNVVGNEKLNSVTANFLNRHFRKEIEAMVIASIKFGVIIVTDYETLEFMRLTYQNLGKAPIT
jgi:hypothetical protein